MTRQTSQELKQRIAAALRAAPVRDASLAKLEGLFSGLDFAVPHRAALHILHASAPGCNIHQAEDYVGTMRARGLYAEIEAASHPVLVDQANDITVGQTNDSLAEFPPDSPRVLLLLDVHQNVHSRQDMPRQAPRTSRRGNLQKTTKTNAHEPFSTNYLALSTAWLHGGQPFWRPTALYHVGALKGSLATQADLAAHVARQLHRPSIPISSSRLGIDVPADRNYDAPSFINPLHEHGLDPLVRLKGPNNPRLRFQDTQGEIRKLDHFIDASMHPVLPPEESSYLDRRGERKTYDYFPGVFDVRLDANAYRLFLKVSVRRVAGKWRPYKEDSIYLLGRADGFHSTAMYDFSRRWDIEVGFYRQALAEADARPVNTNHEYLMLWMAQYHAMSGVVLKDDLMAYADPQQATIIRTMNANRMSWMAHGLLG